MAEQLLDYVREATVEEKFAAGRRAWARQPAIVHNTRHRIYLGDSQEMEGLSDQEKVHLIVTSPPYWNLKKYPEHGAGGQLGNVDDRNEFLAGLEKVWRNCFERLVPGGRLCVVVGDVCRSRRVFGRHYVEPLHAYIQVQCQHLGFDPLAPIIWSKIANLATEVKGNGAGFLGKPYEPNAIIKNDIEFILLFRKPADYRHPTQDQRDLSLISKEDHQKWFRQLWSDVPGELRGEHPAPFPVEIARRLIGMFSFVGDTVLDPFGGTGTTTVAAMRMHRSSIGFEIEPKYIDLWKKRKGTIPLFSNTEFYCSGKDLERLTTLQAGVNAETWAG